MDLLRNIHLAQGPFHELGFYPIIMSEAERMALVGWAMPAAPEDIPHNATNAQVTQFVSATGLFNTARAYLSALDALIVNLVPAHISEPWRNDNRLITLRFPELYARLFSEFGRLTLIETGNAVQQLKTLAAVGTDFAIVAAHHRRIHASLASNGAPVAEALKTLYLQNACAPLGPWVATTIIAYNAKYPAVPDQTFERMYTDFAAAYRNLGATTMNPYAAPATSAPPAPEIATMRAEIAQLKALVKTLQPASAAATQPPAPRVPKYCWSHGASGHTGPECKHPKTGHQASAIITNRQQGSTHRVDTNTYHSV